MYFGVLLIIVGTILLLKNLGLMNVAWDIIWPVIIVLTGLSMVMRRSHWCHGKWMKMYSRHGECKDCSPEQNTDKKQ